jgi:hypothetical protein
VVWKLKPFSGFGLVFAEELLEIVEKADQNHDGRACQADEEQNFKQPHEENRESHSTIIYRRALRTYKEIDVELQEPAKPATG